LRPLLIMRTKSYNVDPIVPRQGSAVVLGTGNTKYLSAPRHARRIRRILEHLDNATELKDLNHPAYRLHRYSDGRWSIDINGPWRMLFKWDDRSGDAVNVELQQPH
jgi:plasmid maintenance system killer protein